MSRSVVTQCSPPAFERSTRQVKQLTTVEDRLKLANQEIATSDKLRRELAISQGKTGGSENGSPNKEGGARPAAMEKTYAPSSPFSSALGRRRCLLSAHS